MADQSTSDRLAALQRARQHAADNRGAQAQPPAEAAGQASPRSTTQARPRSRVGSGTKWTLAGGAVGATFTLMGAMAAGQATAEAEPVSQPAPVAPAPQIIVVVQQPATDAAVSGNQAVAEAVAELPEAVPQQETVNTAKKTESGGS